VSVACGFVHGDVAGCVCWEQEEEEGEGRDVFWGDGAYRCTPRIVEGQVIAASYRDDIKMCKDGDEDGLPEAEEHDQLDGHELAKRLNGLHVFLEGHVEHDQAVHGKCL